MNRAPVIDDARRRVWVAFAEHFLDTETRQELPHAALVAVEAGFSIEETREIWRYEVTPAVGFNLWDMAGEWACWDTEWLCARIERSLARRRHAPRWLRYLAYRITIHFGNASWVAIERLMRALLAVPPPAREPLAHDLGALAQHFFDFLPRDLGLAQPARREELRRLFVEVFLPALRPAVIEGKAEEYARRVEEALR